MAIGYVIHLILGADRPANVVLMVEAMLGFAAPTSARRARPLPGAVLLAVVAIGGSTLVTLGLTLSLLGIIPGRAPHVIPIARMIIGTA